MNVLKNNILFNNIDEKNIESLLHCLQAYQKEYQKNEVIFYQGDITQYLGLVLEGELLITKDDYWGNRSIVEEVKVGELFAEAYACLMDQELEVTIVAKTECKILFLDIAHLIRPCGKSCSFHHQIIQNLLMISAKKNLLLTQKMEHLTKRTMRQKILSYLSEQSLRQGKDTIVIPFNRQEFADYLSVDRSALSIELSKMQKDGILSFQKNSFHLYK